MRPDSKSGNNIIRFTLSGQRLNNKNAPEYRLGPMNTPKPSGVMGRLGLSFFLAFSVCLSATPVPGQGNGQGSSNVEKEEEEYLKGIIRPEEKIERDWGKSSPHGRGGQKSFDGPDQDQDSRSVEDPESIKLYDSLTSKDRLVIKKSVLHKSNIHVTKEFEKQTARLKGKVPYEDWDLHLIFKPSPAARSNEVLKNWEKKRWEELVARNKQEQFRKSLLAGFDNSLVQVLSEPPRGAPNPGAERAGSRAAAGKVSRQTDAAKSVKSSQARGRTDSPGRTAGAFPGSARHGTPGGTRSAEKATAGRQTGVAGTAAAAGPRGVPRKPSAKGTAAKGTAAAGGAKPSRVGVPQGMARSAGRPGQGKGTPAGAGKRTASSGAAGAAPSAGRQGQGKGTPAGAGKRTASSGPAGAAPSGSSGGPSAFENMMRKALEGFDAAQSARPGGSAKPGGPATPDTGTAAGKAPGTSAAHATAQSRTTAQPKIAGTGTAAKGAPGARDARGAKERVGAQTKPARAANTALQRPGASRAPSGTAAAGQGKGSGQRSAKAASELQAPKGVAASGQGRSSATARTASPAQGTIAASGAPSGANKAGQSRTGAVGGSRDRLASAGSTGAKPASGTGKDGADARSAAGIPGAGRSGTPGREGPATAPGGDRSGGASMAASASPPGTVAAAATGDAGHQSGTATGSGSAGKPAGSPSTTRAMSGSGRVSSTGTMKTADASAGSSPVPGTASPAARSGRPAGATGAPGAASGQAADGFAARFGFGKELAMLSGSGVTPASGDAGQAGTPAAGQGEAGANTGTAPAAAGDPPAAAPPSTSEPATAGDSAGDGMESASGAGADGASMADSSAGGAVSGEAGGNGQPADRDRAPPAAPGAEMQAAAQSDGATFDRTEQQTQDRAGADDPRTQQIASLTDPAGEAGGTDTGRPISGLLSGQKPEDAVQPSPPPPADRPEPATPPRLSQDQLAAGKRLLDRIDRGEMKPGELDPAQKNTLRDTLAVIEKSDAGSVLEMRARADRKAQTAKEIREDRAKLAKEIAANDLALRAGSVIQMIGGAADTFIGAAGELAGPAAKTVMEAYGGAKTVVSAGHDIADVAGKSTGNQASGPSDGAGGATTTGGKPGEKAVDAATIAGSAARIGANSANVADKVQSVPEQQRISREQVGLSVIGAGQNTYSYYRAVQSGDTGGASISGVKVAGDLADMGRATSEATRAAGGNTSIAPGRWGAASRLAEGGVAVMELDNAADAYRTGDKELAYRKYAAAGESAMRAAGKSGGALVVGGAHKVYEGYTGWQEAKRLSTVTNGSLNTMDRLANRAEAGARIDREIADLAERAQREPGILERLRRYLREIDVP